MSKLIEIWTVSWIQLEHDEEERETYREEHEEQFFDEDKADKLYNELDEFNDEHHTIEKLKIEKTWGDAEDYEIRDDSIEA
jgi:hypothetical protein